MTHPLIRRLLLPMLLAAPLALLISCAAKDDSLPPAVDWQMTPEAHVIYHYLLLQDAKRTQSVNIGQYAIEQLTEFDPSPQIYLEGANFYWQANENDLARTLLEEALELYPKNAQLLLMLAQVNYGDQEYSQAADALRAYLDVTPEDYLSRQDLADILITEGRSEEALQILEEIPDSEWTSVTRYFKAKALGALGQRNEAASLLRRVVKDDPQLLEAWAELAYIYELGEDFEQAEATYSELLKQGESGLELWRRLVELNIRLGNNDRALSLARQAPDELAFLLSAATLFMDNGLYDEAEIILKDKLERDPSPEVLFYLSMLEYQGRQNAEASKAYLERITPGDNYYDRSLQFQAHLAYELGDVDAALEAATKGRELYPENQEFWLLEARLLESQDKVDEASDLLHQALEVWPDDTEILYTLGVIYDRIKDYDKAMELMEHIIRLDPVHADALNYVGYTLADREEDLDRALDLVQQALDLKPDNGYIIDSLAWVYFKKDQLEDAWEVIQAAVESVDTDPIIWEHYGDIAQALGLKEEAAKGYNNALEAGSSEPDALKDKLEQL